MSSQKTTYVTNISKAEESFVIRILVSSVRALICEKVANQGKISNKDIINISLL